MSVPAQRSFAGGEIAPALYARTDQLKYATGLRTCRNLIVRRHGGVANRPGSVFIAEAKDSAVAVRLIPFVRDATVIGDTYVIELGNGYARFYQNGARVSTSGVGAWANTTAYAVGDLVSRLGIVYYCTTAHTSATATDRPGDGTAWQSKWYAQAGTIYEIPTPYATADLPDLQFSQKGNVITLTHLSYAPRELTRSTNTKWVLTAIAFGPSIAAPTNLALSGGGAGTIRYWAVTAIKENTFEESLPTVVSSTNKVPSASSPVSVSWNAVAGAISYNVYRSNDGQTYGLINSAGGNPIATSDSGWTDSDETATTLAQGVWTPAAGQCRNPIGAISATIRAFDGKYTITGNLTMVADSALGLDDRTYGRFKVYYSRDSEGRVLAGTSDAFEMIGPSSGATFPVSLPVNVPDNGYATLTIDVVPEVLSAIDGISCSVEFVAGAVGWLGGVSGFSDAGATEDSSIAPPTEPALFVAGGYPAANTNYQQRRIFGHTTPDPETVWGSRIGSTASFTKSTPLQDDDMVQFAMSGQLVQVVKHLMDLGRLLVFTTAGVFQCGSADDGSLTPTTANPREVDGQGIGRLAPIKVSDSALFVETGGSLVRDLQPWQAGGALGGYTGKDLTVFAAHLFDDYTIVDWAYAKKPNSVIWAVRSDGTLLGLTYLREFAVWGWHRHDTDGTFENVCVLPEGRESAVYAVVNRTIDGETKRYVERFASRSVTDQRDGIFSDSATSYDGRNAGAVTLAITGGSAWTFDELLTVTAVGGTPFTAGNVGDAAVFTTADGTRIEIAIEQYVSTSVVKGHPRQTVPAELRVTATATWTLAVSKLGGLDHLEGKAVSVLADGFVEASPNNSAYATVTVAGGIATFARAYGVVHVGLPFISDLETLDLDLAGERSIKTSKSNIVGVGVYTEASRGIWAGRSDEVSATSPLAGLSERKGRSTEPYDSPPDPFTGYFEINAGGTYDFNGGVLIRQVDPIPMTILAVMPLGYLGGA